MAKRAYYITTTLPYVNADPHIGFALEIVQADAVARLRRLQGDEVLFNTGTDEHGQKIYQKALEEGKDPQAYTDEYAAKFDRLKPALSLSYTNFIRTTDPNHKEAAQEMWRRCLQNGDIYKAQYKVKYCVGCELPKTESELVDGRCPLHPNLELEVREEENYFFRFSKYQEPLLRLYRERPDFVKPAHRLREVQHFVEQGLQDFSISRLKTKMPWGVPVPEDPDHVMYVWFDALTNYISTLGWPDSQDFSKWWPGVQVAGKDNLRQQSAMWQAMLMSAGLPPSKQIFIHGFVTADGQKMSKSLGNVINPLFLADKYGTEAVRYYLLAKLPAYEDGDFTIEKFEEAYQADLANGLGNLVARVAAMAASSATEYPAEQASLNKTVAAAVEEYQFDEAIATIWSWIRESDVLINSERVWELTPEKRTPVLLELVRRIREIGTNLQPFLPQTAESIRQQFAGPQIKRASPLFPRLTGVTT